MSAGRDFVAHLYGKPVVVKLHSCSEYRGILLCLDNYLNVALRDAGEYNRGQKVNSFSHLFVRGNNVWFVCEDSEPSTTPTTASVEEDDQ